MNVLSGSAFDKCIQKAEQFENFVYQCSFDSTYRIIRFSTQTLDSLFTLSSMQSGHWKNGRAAMYEIRNAAEGIILSCIACPTGLTQRERTLVQQLAKACNAAPQNGNYQLTQWELGDSNENINQAIEELNQVFAFELSYFETELAAWKNNPNRQIRPFPYSNQELVHDPNAKTRIDHHFTKGAIEK